MLSKAIGKGLVFVRLDCLYFFIFFIFFVDRKDGTERVAKVPFLGSFRADVFGRPCYISRLGYTGEDGFEIAMKHGDAEHICDLLVGDESSVIPVVLSFFFCLSF